MTEQTKLTWKADTSDYDERIGTGSLLQYALRASGAHKIASIKDHGGVCAYETDRTILVAKKETYGDIVSISNHILKTAIEQGKPVVMFMGRNRAFYAFDPLEILEQTKFVNERYGVLMNNFSIKLGRRIA